MSETVGATGVRFVSEIERQPKKRKKAGGTKPVEPSRARRRAGSPQGFEATLARLRAKREEIDAAIRTLEAVESLL